MDGFRSRMGANHVRGLLEKRGVNLPPGVGYEEEVGAEKE
jgi:hypothetical protein